MMRNQLTAGSTDQAQAILGAWRSGDIKLFREQLDHIGGDKMETAASEEEERLELLRAIAMDLRSPSIQAAVDDPGNVYSDLLRHLAFSRRLIEPVQQLLQTNLTNNAGRNDRALVLQ